MNILGIDLAGKRTNSTGICIVYDNKIEFKTVHSDKQILNITSEVNPDIIAIDAPIMHGKPRVRKVDKLLIKYRALPPSLPSMKSLTRRGSKLAAQLKTRYNVIEVFPTATAKILGIYSNNYREVEEKLDVKVKNKHELDAYLCALTAMMFLEGDAIEVGSEDGKVIVPKSSIYKSNGNGD